MTTAIHIEGLGKRYRLGATHAGSVRELANRAARRLLGRSTDEPTHGASDFWALDDVSFDVAAGEAIGIIGRNGAGKSTLLKILSKITPPTTGRVELAGRVASLLEVGTGFHPELSGRENVLLNGTILGMTRAEVLRQFDSIVQFAGVEQFIDTPVKRYSSGMTVRLGFAVAAHLDPEILIVDEVLAVGDLEFQQRCLGKMNEVAHSGRTVLFVSHNLASIRQLTTQCALLSRGRLEFHGDTAEALSRYVRGGRSSELGTIYDVANVERPFGGLSRQLEFVRLTLVDNEHGDFLEDGRLAFTVRLRARDHVEGFRLGMTIFRDDQTAVGSGFSPVLGPVVAGAELELQLAIDDLPLADGEFYCAISAGQARTAQQWELFDSVSEVLRFRVTQGAAGSGFQHWQPGWGPVRLPDMELNGVIEASDSSPLQTANRS